MPLEMPERMHREELEKMLKKAGEKARYNANDSAWMYPLQGIVYFALHPVLYRAAKTPILRQLALNSVVIGTMFVFFYLPQVAIMALFSGPLAFVSAVPVVLAESSVIVKLIQRFFFDLHQQETLDYIFDETLAQEGFITLASQGHDPLPAPGPEGQLLGKRNVPSPPPRKVSGLLRYLVSLPLNAIPVVGTILFAIWNGRMSGADCHRRYFQLLRFSDEKKKEAKEKRMRAYTAFGTTVNLLNIVIPFGSVITSFTSTVGAALWAIDLEKEKGLGVAPPPTKTD
ncbi:hypothetical protein BT69DRAFT_1256937 [Atractiella rhizophila]|nr:hypothetical protein BT69DRAFT_1256937 [Atractiella rhizophila]